MKRFLLVAGCLGMSVLCGVACVLFAWEASPLSVWDLALALFNAMGCGVWALLAADTAVPAE